MVSGEGASSEAFSCALNWLRVGLYRASRGRVEGLMFKKTGRALTGVRSRESLLVSGDVWKIESS